MAEPMAQLAQLLSEFEQQGVRQVRLALTDLDGVLRGKYVSVDKFAGLLRDGGGFCDCILGWDVADQLYDGGRLTGWHTGFPDARYRLLADSRRWFEDDRVPFFLGEFVAADGTPHSLCPRTLYARTLAALADQGLGLRGGFEYEFFVFAETPHSVQDKGFRDLTPITPGNFGYSILRAATYSDVFTEFMDYCEDLDLNIEGLHCETGPGVWEAALAPAGGVDVADRANLFKTYTKVFFEKREHMATFMAKWSMDYPGQSGHFHFSLLDDTGGNVFRDDADANGLSSRQRHALGGVLHLLPSWLALLAPTVNSYTRLVRGAWAPTASTWGIDNRTTALRVIPGAKAQRIECRVSGADANPYLVAAAMSAAASWGIREQVEPPEPVQGNAYDVEAQLPDAAQFPKNLLEAADRLVASPQAHEYFGSSFVEHFAMSRRWEYQQQAQQVTDWQLARYFEII